MCGAVNNFKESVEKLEEYYKHTIIIMNLSATGLAFTLNIQQKEKYLKA
jgi:hypothetical protein